MERSRAREVNIVTSHPSLPLRNRSSRGNRRNRTPNVTCGLRKYASGFELPAHDVRSGLLVSPLRVFEVNRVKCSESVCGVRVD